ncbi:uncharacterized protein MYCGRDRAFT_97720 [Zymoseptoria tritici IPO323]|uniref:Uncharacterized protein n=1 Tax=Zymoseptoria tritici (strain CBS 115943 / IPO323) TaxID=336722 RepID=F9XR60_ZYMTI|nr:uncharacterized protein MYCGRDRAFT_97720 [Zymoseptoria tritici IPO323]EGP82268.1 hypothetical protein MYCGRDRAFT_97720 [Zymoseptoria tritici IPO323]
MAVNHCHAANIVDRLGGVLLRHSLDSHPIDSEFCHPKGNNLPLENGVARFEVWQEVLFQQTLMKETSLKEPLSKTMLTKTSLLKTALWKEEAGVVQAIFESFANVPCETSKMTRKYLKKPAVAPSRALISSDSLYGTSDARTDIGYNGR